MHALAFHLLGVTASLLASITVRDFSLVTDKGENVFQTNFYRRRLSGSILERLALKFNTAEKQFKFELESTHPIFAPGAKIKIIGRVREQKKKPNAMPRANTTQHNTTQHTTTQHNTTQHNTTRNDTTPHNTTQRETALWQFRHQKLYHSPVPKMTRQLLSSTVPL